MTVESPNKRNLKPRKLGTMDTFRTDNFSDISERENDHESSHSDNNPDEPKLSKSSSGRVY